MMPPSDYSDYETNLKLETTCSCQPIQENQSLNYCRTLSRQTVVPPWPAKKYWMRIRWGSLAGLPLSGIGRPPISSTIHPPTLAGWCPAGKPSWDRLTLENPPQGPTRTLPPRLENAHPTWIYSIKGGHLGFRFFTPPRSSDLLKHWHYFHEMATKFSPRVTTWPYFGWNFRS